MCQRYESKAIGLNSSHSHTGRKGKRGWDFCVSEVGKQGNWVKQLTLSHRKKERVGLLCVPCAGEVGKQGNWEAKVRTRSTQLAA